MKNKESVFLYYIEENNGEILTKKFVGFDIDKLNKFANRFTDIDKSIVKIDDENEIKSCFNKIMFFDEDIDDCLTTFDIYQDEKEEEALKYEEMIKNFKNGYFYKVKDEIIFLGKTFRDILINFKNIFYYGSLKEELERLNVYELVQNSKTIDEGNEEYLIWDGSDLIETSSFDLDFSIRSSDLASPVLDEDGFEFNQRISDRFDDYSEVQIINFVNRRSKELFGYQMEIYKKISDF